MNLRLLIFAATFATASTALATGTGPTLPEKSREHPLDNREPRQDVIDQQNDTQRQPRPPTLEAPPEVPPVEPTEHPSRPDLPERRGTDASGNRAPAS
jgi:hypothetical protein